MSLTCKDLLNLKHFQKIKLVAGKEGLNRVITYPYVGQTASVSDWVHGGELLFITGLVHSEEQLPLLLQECIDKQLAGLVVLTNSEYIEKLPDSLIDMANEAKFPLFSMPWDLRLVDVTHEITHAIDYDQMESEKIHRLLNHLIFSPDVKEKPSFDHEAIVNLKVTNYNFIAIFTMSKESAIEDDPLEAHLQYYLDKLCTAKSIPGHSIIYGNRVVLLTSARSQKNLENYISYLETVYDSLSLLCNDSNLLLAIGDIHKGASQIRTSYQEASDTMTIMQKTGFKKICRYKDLGMYRLFLQMKPSEMEYFYRNKLDALIEYDQNNHTDFMLTLKTYLECFNNISQTTKKLVIHRNTLLYRLNKIQEILNCRLADPVVCIELLLALVIKRYLDNLEKAE